MVTRLDSLDTDFKLHHMVLIETIKEKDKLMEEQSLLDNHDDRMLEFVDRLPCLIEENEVEEQHWKQLPCLHGTL